VALRTLEELEVWMTASANDALKLQRLLPDDALRIMAQGRNEDSGSAVTVLSGQLP
jgi:hypothetical protein